MPASELREPVEDLPFECPGCGGRFGLGPAAVLLSVVTRTSVNEPTPCCGYKAPAVLERDGRGGLMLTWEGEDDGGL